MKQIKKISILTILLSSFILLWTVSSAQSPQVLRISQIKETARVWESLQRNGDHLYTRIEYRNNANKDITEDLEIDSFLFVDNILYLDSSMINENGMLILDYEVGNGFVDYDFISHVGRHGGFEKNDSLVAFSVGSSNCTWNGKTYHPELHPDSILLTDYGNYIAVIDHLRDSLMFLTRTPQEYRLSGDQLTLDGDHLYVVTRTNEDTFEFMGEYFPEVIDPNWNVKYIHKINWKTGVKEWSRQFSTDIDQDYLFDIKVVEDGNLIIAKRITGRTHWDGVSIEGNSVYDGGYAFFKVSPDGELVDYLQSVCDCKGFHKMHIEDDGALMLYGAQRYMPNLTLGDASLELYSDTLYGLFGFVPPDWENAWIKTYHGTYQNAVTGGAFLLDNTILTQIGFKEEIQVEGTDFVTADAGIFPHPEDGKGENVLVSYNIDGTLAKNPISIPLDARIYEIHEVNKNHYLFYIKEGSGATSTLFDTQLDNYGPANFMIFEIEGELFDIVDNLDELIEPYLLNVHVYPNPATSQQEITVMLKNELTQIDNINLISLDGKASALSEYTIEHKKINIKLPALDKGLYSLQIQGGSINYTTKLIIK